jgi:hypothetical protein
MKHGWIGIVAGLAIGTAAVLLTQHPQAPAPVRKPQANAGELATRCMAPIKPMYDKTAEALHKYLATEPSKALDAARGQVANVIEIRLAVCEQALAIRQSEKASGSAGPEVYRDLARLTPFVEKLRAGKARLDELTQALSSPQPTGAQDKLDALDTAMHAMPDDAVTTPGSAGSAH